MVASDIDARVAAVRARLAGTGRDVELVAVTKGFGADAIVAAAAAGCTMIGENYAQELRRKLDAAAPLLAERGLAPPTVHFIGRLQSNKVRTLAGAVDVWESVDRRSLLDEIARRAPGAVVLIQVNATGESGKGGCRPDAVVELVAHGRRLGLDVDGLMTIGPTDLDPSGTAAAFAAVRQLADDLALPTRSMGMSDDLDLALDAGSTRVRVGTALFGRRPTSGAGDGGDPAGAGA